MYLDHQLTLEGYFDDSGTHATSSVVAVAGYISTPEQWSMFAKEWKAALLEWDLQFFHMTDFANRAPKSKYIAWSDQERRHRFAKLAGIINRHVIASVGITIPKREFDRVFFAKSTRAFVGGAFGLAASACFLETANLLEAYTSSGIAYTFEAGSKGAGEVSKVFNWNHADIEQRRRLKLLSLNFKGKHCEPLQAADILAYALYKRLPQEIGLSASSAAQIATLNLLSACKLKSWGQLEESELLKWEEIIALSATYNAQHSRKDRKKSLY